MNVLLRPKAIVIFLGVLGALLTGLGLGLAIGGAPGWILGCAATLLCCASMGMVYPLWARDRSRGKALREFFTKSVREQSRATYHIQRLGDTTRDSTKALSEVADQLSVAVHSLGELKAQQAAPSNSVTLAARAMTQSPAQVRRLDAGGRVKRVDRAPLKVVLEREYRPMTGWTAKQWSASRQAGSRFVAEEKQPAYRTGEVPFASDIPVAMIADDFTFNSFRSEFDTCRLHPQTWRETFEKVKPQLFFCESAWQGGDPSKAPWQGRIYSSARFSHENRQELLNIIEYCRKNGIPTVFWNKEDPTHYGDRINDFIRTAYLFDYVFTTAEECVPRYEYDLKRGNVDVLPFAVQPRMFNPLAREHAKDRANFAGTWYGMYPERSRAAEQIMDIVLATGRELVIYDRMFGHSNPVYRYPERFRTFVRPSIPYAETAATYKQSRFGITLNTVTDSNTMFARRVFELAASGAVVLSNYSKGVERFFGDSVIFVDRDPVRFTDMSESTYMDLQQRALTVALDNTYTHRAETILRAAGIKFISRYEAPAAFGTVATRAEFNALRANAALSGLEGGVACVGENADPGLLMQLMREHIPGWVSVSASELARQDYRTRNLLDRRGVVVADESQEFPDRQEIGYLSSHWHYTGLPVVHRKAGETSFSTGCTGLSGAYVPAEAFRDALASPTASTVMFV